VTRGKAGKVRIDLKRMKAVKVIESTTKVSEDHDDGREYGQFDNGDVVSMPPTKRARISEKPERKNYKASVVKKYGSWPPPPAANVAEVRGRMAETRRDVYGPATVRRMPGEPYMFETELEFE
jgi:hypothetical protein